MGKKCSSLEELSLRSDFILLDNSVLLGTYECLSDRSRVKMECAQESLGYFLDRIDLVGNLLLTEKMYLELSNFEEFNKGKEKSCCSTKKDFLKYKEVFLKGKKSFLDKIALGGNILSLSKREERVYDGFYSKYYLKKKRHGLSVPDYDLAISALVCAKNKEKACIISNDNGIKKIWYDFLDLESGGENIGFFNHVSLGLFREVSKYGKYKV